MCCRFFLFCLRSLFEFVLTGVALFCWFFFACLGEYVFAGFVCSCCFCCVCFLFVVAKSCRCCCFVGGVDVCAFVTCVHVAGCCLLRVFVVCCYFFVDRCLLFVACCCLLCGVSRSLPIVRCL